MLHGIIWKAIVRALWQGVGLRSSRPHVVIERYLSQRDRWHHERAVELKDSGHEPGFF